MEHTGKKVQALAADVRSMIRTGVALTSFAQAVEELVLNAVDAKATSIAVRIDLSSFKLQVVDNGLGITVDQLPLIGDRYSTSKCHCVKDLDNLKYFGYRGEALASLRNVASFLEIVSRPKGTCLTYSKCFQKGKSLGISQPSTHRPAHGTTITAYELFYNLPVRQNGISKALETEKVRYRLAGISLMWPKTSISLRDDSAGNVILQTQKCFGVLATFSQLFTPSRAKGLVEINIDTDDFKISGIVSKESYSRKDLQFVFVNKRLVLKSSIHKQVNKIFRRSLILKRKGTNGEESEKVRTYSEAGYPQGSPSKQVDQYAIYVLNIECSFKEYDITFDPSKTLIEFRDWLKLIHTLQDMLYGFLRKEHLLPPNTCSPTESEEKLCGFQKIRPSLQPGNSYPYRHDDDNTGPHQFSMTNMESLYSETVCRPRNPMERKSMSFVHKWADERRDISLSHESLDSDQTKHLPAYSYLQNAKQNDMKKNVCFNIDDRLAQMSHNTNATTGYSGSSRVISLNPNKSLNPSKPKENSVLNNQPKIKLNNNSQYGISKTCSIIGIATDTSRIDEEEPLADRSVSLENESEHPLQMNDNTDDTVRCISLRKSAGYSSSLKCLRDINPFNLHKAPNNASEIMVHTLQDLRMFTRKYATGVNEILKTPEKATRRKSFEVEQDSSPSKQQKLQREDASTFNECANNMVPNSSSDEGKMHVDFVSCDMEHMSSSDIPSPDHNYEMETSNNERVDAKESTEMKKPSHASKLAKIMKEISKSKDKSDKGELSQHKSRLKSFTYGKKGKFSSNNTATIPDYHEPVLTKFSAASKEKTRMNVSKEIFQSIHELTHVCDESEACVNGTTKTQNLEAINHQLPFAMYSNTKEKMRINTPKLSLVLSMPICTEQSPEQLPSHGFDNSDKMQVNHSESSQLLHKTLPQNVSPDTIKETMNVETAPTEFCDIKSQGCFQEKVDEKIPADIDQEDCLSQKSQGFGFCDASTHNTPLIKLYKRDDPRRFPPSQGFSVKLSADKHSPRVQASEWNTPAHNVSNNTSGNEQDEKSGHQSGKDNELDAEKILRRKNVETNSHEVMAPSIIIDSAEDDYHDITYGNKLYISQTNSTPDDAKTSVKPKSRNPWEQHLFSVKESTVQEPHLVETFRSIGQEGNLTGGSCFIIDRQDFNDNCAPLSLSVTKIVNSTDSFPAHEDCGYGNDSVVKGLSFHRNEALIQYEGENPENTYAVHVGSGSSSIPCGQEISVKENLNCESGYEYGHNSSVNINNDNSSIMPCAQKENIDLNVNVGNSSCLSSGVGENTSETINSESGSCIQCEDRDNVIENAKFEINDSIYLPLIRPLSSSSDTEPGTKVYVDINRKDEIRHETFNSRENEMFMNLSGQKMKLISLSNVTEETTKAGTFAVGLSSFKLKNISSMDVKMDKESNYLSANEILHGETQTLQEAEKVVNNENVLQECLLSSQKIVDTNQDFADENEMETQWQRITLSSSGTSVYINNKSGHSISEHQWSKLSPKDQEDLMEGNSKDQIQKTGNDTNATADEDVNGDNAIMFSKWRDMRRPTYDANKGEDVGSVVTEWTDTVFLKYKLPSQLFINCTDEKKSKSHSHTPNQIEFTKEMLHSVKFLGQVDNKFLACTIEKKNTMSRKANAPLLVFFDQHAVHERVRLESLTSEVYESIKEATLQRIKREKINIPLSLQLNQDDVRVMKAFTKEFDRIGVEFTEEEACRDTIHVHSVPLCMTESKRIKGALKKKIEELIREHIDLLKSTNGTCGKLPLAIHRVLCSQACRGAIKFGDPLSSSECEELLSSLSFCNLPFQCAHGRPSIAPLINLLDLEVDPKDLVKRPRLQNITRLMKDKSEQKAKH